MSEISSSTILARDIHFNHLVYNPASFSKVFAPDFSTKPRSTLETNFGSSSECCVNTHAVQRHGLCDLVANLTG